MTNFKTIAIIIVNGETFNAEITHNEHAIEDVRIEALDGFTAWDEFFGAEEMDAVFSAADEAIA